MARWLLDELLSDFLISDAYVNQPVSGSPSTDTGAGGALSSRTGMAQYSQHHLRRPSGHIHNPTQGAAGLAGQWQPVGTTQHEA